MSEAGELVHPPTSLASLQESLAALDQIEILLRIDERGSASSARPPAWLRSICVLRRSKLNWFLNWFPSHSALFSRFIPLFRQLLAILEREQSI
jgi:hypothetical protein